MYGVTFKKAYKYESNLGLIKHNSNFIGQQFLSSDKLCYNCHTYDSQMHIIPRHRYKLTSYFRASTVSVLYDIL